MMTCGCAAQVVQVLKDGSRIPACITHDCTEIAASKPDLTSRKARCAYYGGRTAKRGSYGGGNECNYGQDRAPICTCEQPSSSQLPFFEHKAAEPFDKFYCGCHGWD